ncbi:HAD family hydrolase [Candidatus Woesearchaeota archaeon]|nr:HAD family hydrolase [Candidatus Woesearchaeota archaeon]
MIKAIVFDCDGTVYDIKVYMGEITGLKRAFKELGIKAGVPKKETILGRCGTPKPDFFHGIIPEKYFRQAYRLAYKYTEEDCEGLVKAKKGKLYSGAIKTLKQLKKKGIKLGLVTNGGKGYIRAVAGTYSLQKVFDVVMSVEEVKGDKGDLVKAALKRLGVKPKEALMVGDRKSDIDAARKAGCKTVAVTYGYGSRRELEGADYVISDLKQLMGVMRNA